MRILHFHNIAGQGSIIVDALRKLGHEAEVWEYAESLAQLFPHDRFVGAELETAEQVWSIVTNALDRGFDIVHCHGNRSLAYRETGPLPAYWDLPLLKALGKKVFFTFHGSDIRLKSVDMELYKWSYYKFADVPSAEEDILRRREIIRLYADAMFVCSFLDIPFIPEAEWYPLAIRLGEWPAVGPKRKERPLVVHPWVDNPTKGTRFIREGLERLKAEGVPFDVRYMERVPHDEARRILSDADIIVDRVVAGTYGMVSIEAMAMGKPTVAQLEPEVTANLPDLPVYDCNPETFVENMRRLLTDYDLRLSLGERGRRFVEERHDSVKVAQALLKHYEKAPKKVSKLFPDWYGVDNERKREALERQISALEEKVAVMRRQSGGQLPLSYRLREPFGRFRILKPTPRRIRKGLRLVWARLKRLSPASR